MKSFKTCLKLRSEIGQNIRTFRVKYTDENEWSLKNVLWYHRFADCKFLKYLFTRQ